MSIIVPNPQSEQSPSGDNALNRRYAPRGLTRMIFLKELREIFRDRRTRFGAIVSPLLITPLIIWISGQFVHSQQKTEAKTVYSVGVVGGSASPL